LAAIKLNRPDTPTVHVPDHDGRRTGQTLPLTDGRIALDGPWSRTIYRELDYR